MTELTPETRKYLKEIASKGGSRNTEAQNAARRLNAKKAGRKKGSKNKRD